MSATEVTAAGGGEDEVAQLDRNWAVLSRLVTRAERHARRGRHEQAAVTAMTAATFAWCNPTGVFASPRLEEVLAGLGATLPEPRPVPRPVPRPTGGRPSVLHVATQLYPTGGHTQMLANWLRLDDEREHHVCLTGQEGRPVPDKITAALTSPTALVRLDDARPRLMDRAAALRDLAQQHDHVVLHAHPHDVVAGIGLAHGAGRPEVLLVNHADHVFWVGTGTADRIVNLRHSGARHNVERRGVPEARNALLVRPLHLRDRELSRAQARAELGIAPDAVVVASAADTYKYAAAQGAGLLDVLLPVLRDHPEARLHVAGPSPDGEWSVLAEQGLGRAWGLLPDVRTLLEAADVYVDSYPFSSLTSMLEAASLDTPVLTLRPADDRLGVLGADTPELDDHLVVARSADELARELARLVAEPDRRARLGAATGAAVRRSHADGAWQEQLDKVLDAPTPGCARSVPGAVPRQTGPLDRRLLAVMANGVGRDLGGTLEVVAPVLPWSRRVQAAALLLREGRVRPVLLLPAGAERLLRRARAGVPRQAPRRG